MIKCSSVALSGWSKGLNLYMDGIQIVMMAMLLDLDLARAGQSKMKCSSVSSTRLHIRQVADGDCL